MRNTTEKLLSLGKWAMVLVLLLPLAVGYLLYQGFRALFRLIVRFGRALFRTTLGQPRRHEPPAQSAAATTEPAEPSSGGIWRFVIELASAAAGITVFVTFVGGALFWTRFDALGLPADQAVAVLPTGLLTSVGAGALAPALILGGLVAFVVGLLSPLDDEGQPKLHFAWILRILVAAEFFVLLGEPGVELTSVAAGTAVAILGALAAWGAAIRLKGYRPVGWTLFAAAVLVAGVNAYIRVEAKPEIEPAAVLLTEGDEGVAGFYIGQTSDRLYIAPLTSGGRAALGEDVSGLLELPRDQVARIAIRDPSALGSGERGRAEALALLSEMRTSQATGGEPGGVAAAPVPTEDPVVSFAPLVHLHDNDDYRPMSVVTFLRNSELRWRLDEECDGSFDPIAAGADASDTELDPDDLDYDRLGLPQEGEKADPYEHGKYCDPARGTQYSTTDHTRPFDPSEGEAPEDQGFYLDLDDAAQRGAVREFAARGVRGTVTGAPVYYEKHADELPDRTEGTRITYWLFYGYSVPPGPESVTKHFAHEGDWERVSVLLDPLGDDRYLPISVRFHLHNESVDVPWGEAERVGDAVGIGGPIAGTGPEATHPVAYSAKGSHATFPVPGRHRIKFERAGQEIETVFDDTLACGNCPQWATWEGTLLDARRLPWYGFGGAWGAARENSDLTGPLGPSRFKIQGLELQTEVEDIEVDAK